MQENRTPNLYFRTINLKNKRYEQSVRIHHQSIERRGNNKY